MASKERFFYILKILVLIGIIAWLLFSPKEDYVEEYNNKIKALERKVDSLHSKNEELTFKIDTLNQQIATLDIEIDGKDAEISDLKDEIKDKVDKVDSFTDDELEQFFTNRYRHYLDSIRKANRTLSY